LDASRRLLRPRVQRNSDQQRRRDMTYTETSLAGAYLVEAQWAFFVTTTPGPTRLD
jgi:hypothetical protein